MSDFEFGEIEVRYKSTSWGPWGFDFSDALPEGSVIASVTIRSFLGKIDPGEELTGFTESTTELIDAVKSLPIGDKLVAVYFNYPGAALEGNHSLIFEVTLVGGAQHPFYFYKVKVH